MAQINQISEIWELLNFRMFWSYLILTFSTRFFRSDWKKTISASSIIQTSFDSKFHWLLYEGWLKQISWKIDDLYSKNLRWCALANLFLTPTFQRVFKKVTDKKLFVLAVSFKRHSIANFVGYHFMLDLHKLREKATTGSPKTLGGAG